MKGLDQLALLDAIDRTTRELRILRALVLDRERQAVEAAEKPSRWPDVKPAAIPPSEGPPLSPHICYEACDDIEDTQPQEP